MHRKFSGNVLLTASSGKKEMRWLLSSYSSWNNSDM